jgi:hypothetical protein
LPIECDGDAPPRFHVSLSGGGFVTTLLFDEREVRLSQRTSFVSGSWQRSPAVSLNASLGVIWDGEVEAEGAAAGDVGRGGALAIGATWLVVFEGERRPFVQLSGTAGVSTTSAVSDDSTAVRMSAGDLRGGVLVGKTFWERVTMFAAVRAFGGPVFWRLRGKSVVGTDKHHVSAGLGAIVRLPTNLDVFVELMPLGEQSLSLGAGVSF